MTERNHAKSFFLCHPGSHPYRLGWVGSLLLALACSGDPSNGDSDDSSDGDDSNTSGGASSSGGDSAAGGRADDGGSAGEGGGANSGGSSSSDGGMNSGGANSSGGSSSGGAASGGAASGGAANSECTSGSYDDDDDAETACVAWTVCTSNEGEWTAGTSTSDRVCHERIGQFGTAQSDGITAMARGADGELAVVGILGVEGDTVSRSFVRKYASSELEAWTLQVPGNDVFWDVTVDDDGAIYVVGSTTGTVGEDEPNLGGSDAFIRKYDADGELLWTRQFGTDHDDQARGVAAKNGAVYVVGNRYINKFDGNYQDAFLRTYEADGTFVAEELLETDSFDDLRGVAANDDGDVYVGGYAGGPFDDGFQDALIRKYDSEGNVLWTSEYGADNFETVRRIALDGDENVIAVGFSDPFFNPGNQEGFVVKFDSDGDFVWSNPVSYGSRDDVFDVDTDDEGSVYIVDSTRLETPTTHNEFLLVKYDADSDVQWSLPLSLTVSGITESLNAQGALVVRDVDDFYVAGHTIGALPDRTNAGSDDAFVLRIPSEGFEIPAPN